jgi:hypothetical protein
MINLDQIILDINQQIKIDNTQLIILKGTIKNLEKRIKGKIQLIIYMEHHREELENCINYINDAFKNLYKTIEELSKFILDTFKNSWKSIMKFFVDIYNIYRYQKRVREFNFKIHSHKCKKIIFNNNLFRNKYNIINRWKLNTRNNI